MALESQGSSLLPALPSCTAPRRVSWGGGEAPWTFLSWVEMLLVRGCAEQQQDVLSIRDWGFVCILLTLRHAVPLQVNLWGSYWVSASKALIFWAHHNSDNFSRDASLITSGTRAILGGEGEGNLSRVTPANDVRYPFLFPGKAWHGCLSHMLQCLPLAKQL